ncbi:MAG TPA: hypothetical protein VNK04_11970 [Gemmataceae bacterium]|nr:hypothetical protein [Gemmataceae bacterium]
MFPRFPLVAVLTLAFLAPAARPQAPPPLPALGPAPLLYVRFTGPAGLRATFYRGQTAMAFNAPVTVGLRPGFLYRIQLTGWAAYPGLALYPSLEVCGTLCLPPKVGGADHPAVVPITEQDVERVLAGSLVTKVIYLEDPERPLPGATQPDLPVEIDLPPGTDLMTEARLRGRPMLIVRLGQREVSAEELARASVPGTVLLPGEKVLPAPPISPCVPWAGRKFYDPHLGPRPLTEECLHDGGDIWPKAGFGPDGRLRNVDPSDTVAEYADSHGRRHVAVSNRVCLCVPRFVVLRSECPLARHEAVLGPEAARLVKGQGEVAMRLPVRQTEQYKPVMAVQGRKRPNEVVAREGVVVLTAVEVLEAVEMVIGPAELLGTTAARTLTQAEQTRLLRQIELARELSAAKGTQEVIQTQGPAVIGRVKGLEVIGSVVATRELTVCCNEPPCPPDKPLVLFKWADAQTAQVGDVVTFYLKYSNHGGQPISDVAVVDSLTGRLEYVPGSARSSRAAVFTMQENEAGSVILRWEISGRLLPGESGVVSFQARVR